MSAAAMQSASEPAHLPASSSPYTTSSSSRQYQTAPAQNRDAYYTNQGSYPSTSSRRQGRHNAHAASISSPVSQAAAIDSPYARPLPPSTNNSPQVSVLAASSQSRTRSNAADQYDGPPIPPPRTSSQLPSSPAQVPTTNSSVPGAEARNAGTRHKQQNPADDGNYGSRDQNYAADYSEPIRERPRENSATAAAAAAQNRRKGGPASPNEPDRGPSHKVEGQEPIRSQQPRSDAAPPMLRENSEVINRVIVSDPQVDKERIQERVAEARPAPVGTDVTPITGLGLVGSEGVDDGGRGGARRQEFSKSASRRKDVQFGDYMLGQTLGEGEFGKVKLGWKKDGSTQVAIKLIRRESVATNPTRLPKIYREISILRDLAHPNIVRLHEMVETERHIGIILEYASGGELFDYILNHRYLKDQAARRLFAQLVSGVGYLHKKGIVHRDLKLENLLLDQNRNIIITDFGFANTFNPADELSDEIERNLGSRDFVRKYRLDRQDEKGMRKGDLMQTSCGSPCYAAPELVVSDSLYTGRKVDVWSCGVILVRGGLPKWLP
jgi:protein-serine/threonine kinase